MPPEKIGDSCPKAHLNISAQARVLSGKREKAEQRNQGEGAVDMQAEFFLLTIWIVNGSQRLVGVQAAPGPGRTQDSWFLQCAQKRVLAIYGRHG